MAKRAVGGKGIKNQHGVPIWVRTGCKCATCTALRKLESKRKQKAKLTRLA